jgi:hypothetical protein
LSNRQKHRRVQSQPADLASARLTERLRIRKKHQNKAVTQKLSFALQHRRSTTRPIRAFVDNNKVPGIRGIAKRALSD